MDSIEKLEGKFQRVGSLLIILQKIKAEMQSELSGTNMPDGQVRYFEILAGFEALSGKLVELFDVMDKTLGEQTSLMISELNTIRSNKGKPSLKFDDFNKHN